MTSGMRDRSAMTAAAVLATAIAIGAGTAGATGPDAGAASDEYCDAFVAVEQAFREIPEDPAEIETFVAERVTPQLATLSDEAPESIAEDLGVMVSTVEEVVSTGNFDLMMTPEYSTASTAVYRSLEDGCGFPLVDVLGTDYAFGGIPDTLAAGPTTFVLTNSSEAGELHEMVIVKLVDGVELSVDEILALPEDESEQYVETFAGGLFASPEMTAGTVIDLTPGRWAYVCFLPVGMTPDVMAAVETGGTEPTDAAPHFMEGMYGEFTVE